jgi:hypothetical protein
MGVPTSEVGYTTAMPRREDHEGHVVALDLKKNVLLIGLYIRYVESKPKTALNVNIRET